MTHAPGPIRIGPDAIALQPLDFDPAAFQSPLPSQHGAVIFQDKAIGLAVGIWDTTTMQEAFGPYPGDEYITVLDGRFALVDAADGTLAAAQVGDSVTFRNGAPDTFGPGAHFLLPKGTSCSWETSSGTVAVIAD